MSRRVAIVVITLGKEGSGKPEDIQEDILKFLEESRVPWMENVEKVTVLESDED